MNKKDIGDELDKLEQRAEDQDVEIKGLEFDLKEAQEEIKILNEILDEIYTKADQAYTLVDEIRDMIP